MKKSLKIAGGLFLTAGIVGLIYRYYKREYGKLRAQESSARKEVEEAGISFDKLQDEVTTKDDLEGNTFIKSIATAMFFNNTVPLDYLDLDAAFTGDDGPGGLIHIMESSFNQRRCLDFLFELPNYVKGYFSGINRPRINEYIKTIKSLSEMVNDEIVKGPRPLCKPELYVGVRYILDDNQSLDKDNDCESSYFLIPQPVYADYADDDAVEREPHKAAFLDQVNHPFAGHAAHEERGDEADDAGEDADVAGLFLAGAGGVDVEEGGAEDGDDDHEERERGEAVALVAEEDAGGDCRAGA